MLGKAMLTMACDNAKSMELLINISTHGSAKHVAYHIFVLFSAFLWVQIVSLVFLMISWKALSFPFLGYMHSLIPPAKCES